MTAAPPSQPPIVVDDCPFDSRLARTPYLVLPKLALQAMPIEWRRRFDAMLEEMEAAGIATPEYLVLRDATHGDPHGCVIENEQTGFIRIIRKPADPWANYKYGDAFALSREERDR
jgi:hypothetical protein